MPTFAGCHFNAYLYTSNPPFTPTHKLCGIMQSLTQVPQLRSVRVSYANIKFLSVVFLVSYRRFVPHSHSIVLSCLCPRISVPRGNIIARILLQRIGLRLRALRIELLAKLAFALRRLGSFLVVKEHGQLSVLMFEV